MPVTLRARAAPLAGTRLPRRLRLVFDEPDTLLAYEYRIRELGTRLNSAGDTPSSWAVCSSEGRPTGTRKGCG